MQTNYTPCGGCGATEPSQRCIGCFHPFEGEEKKYPIGIDPQEAWDEFSEYVDDDSDSFSRYAGRTVMLFDSFVSAIDKLQKATPTGAVWVKASERLPEKGGIDNKVIVRGRLNEQGYNNYPFVTYGFRNFSPVKQEMYFEYGSKSFLTNQVEWLDEGGNP